MNVGECVSGCVRGSRVCGCVCMCVCKSANVNVRV